MNGSQGIQQQLGQKLCGTWITDERYGKQPLPSGCSGRKYHSLCYHHHVIHRVCWHPQVCELKSRNVFPKIFIFTPSIQQSAPSIAINCCIPIPDQIIRIQWSPVIRYLIWVMITIAIHWAVTIIITTTALTTITMTILCNNQCIVIFHQMKCRMEWTQVINTFF